MLVSNLVNCARLQVLQKKRFEIGLFCCNWEISCVSTWATPISLRTNFCAKNWETPLSYRWIYSWTLARWSKYWEMSPARQWRLSLCSRPSRSATCSNCLSAANFSNGEFLSTKQTLTPKRWTLVQFTLRISQTSWQCIRLPRSSPEPERLEIFLCQS